MTIVDANLLLYAYSAGTPQQPAAAQWLNTLMESGETIGLPWVTVWAFVRISTNRRIWSNPLSPQQALAIVREWLDLPQVVVVRPGPRHLELLEKLSTDHAATGPLVTDAVLAALALENGAVLASTDQDFARFSRVRWINPLKESVH